MTKQQAQWIAQEIEAIARKMNDLVEKVGHECDPLEAEKFMQNMGLVLAPLHEKVLNPIKRKC